MAPDSYFVYRPLLVTGDGALVPAAAPGRGRRSDAAQGDRHARRHRAARRAHGRGRGAAVRPVAAGARRRSGRCAARRAVLPRPGESGRARRRCSRTRSRARSEASSSPFRAAPGGRCPSTSSRCSRGRGSSTRARSASGSRVVTPEDAPLELFGATASSAIAELLEDRGIELVAGTTPLAFADGELAIAPGGSIGADRAVALPRLEGPRLRGLFCDAHGLPPDRPVRTGRTARSTSGPRGTRRASRSSRAGSPPSRPTRPPSRSRPAPARRSSRARSGRCCAACC